MATPQESAPKHLPKGKPPVISTCRPSAGRSRKAHAAMLSATAGKVALTLPIGADVDDFRRVLAAGAKP